jgi:serine protease
LIQFSPENGTKLRALIEREGGRVVFQYRLISGLAADLTSAALRTVRTSKLATTIEEDAPRFLDSHLPDPNTEITPWGVARVRAPQVWDPDPSDNDPVADPGSPAGQGIIVGVLDTGIDFEHPDLQANIIDVRGSGVIRDFLFGDDDPSDDDPEPLQGHGTSGAGVIAAVDNEIGVIGVAPLAQILPYRVCFANFTEGCPISAIIGGLDQAVADGVDVINMSFGGPAGFNIEASAIQAANQAGVVLVASAGNESTQQPRFPAAYDTVLAVGAINSNNQRASFSNVGGWVDVTGPGVDIPAPTVQGVGRDAFVTENSPTPRSLNPNPMTASALGNVTADLIYVGLATETDVGTFCAFGACAGKIALIQRGAITFAEKVQRVADEGAVGALIFNNQPGNFFGTLVNLSDIPAASLSNAEGLDLLAELGGGAVNVTLEIVATDYDLVSGTSFSGPHAAGVAALVLSANPALSPTKVRSILEKTAIDLGIPNKDVIFGWGIVNAEAAVAAASSE